MLLNSYAFVYGAESKEELYKCSLVSTAFMTDKVDIEPPVKIKKLEIAQADEDIYFLFMSGALIYRPKEGSDEGKIEMPIATLANPLEGTFDLSQCGEASKYFCISTGYRKSKRHENANKLEIWFVPKFVINQELETTAAHFQDITDEWYSPIAIFWNMGRADSLYWTYNTNILPEDITTKSLLTHARNATNRISMPFWLDDIDIPVDPTEIPIDIRSELKKITFSFYKLS